MNQGWRSSYPGAEGTIHHGVQFLSKRLWFPRFCGVENSAAHPLGQGWVNECLRQEHYSKREKRKQEFKDTLATHQMFTANLSRIHNIFADRSLLKEQQCVVLVEEVWTWYCGTWSMLWSWLYASSLLSSWPSTCVSTMDQALNFNRRDTLRQEYPPRMFVWTSSYFTQLHTTSLAIIFQKCSFYDECRIVPGSRKRVTGCSSAFPGETQRLEIQTSMAPARPNRLDSLRANAPPSPCAAWRTLMQNGGR